MAFIIPPEKLVGGLDIRPVIQDRHSIGFISGPAPVIVIMGDGNNGRFMELETTFRPNEHGPEILKFLQNHLAIEVLNPIFESIHNAPLCEFFALWNGRDWEETTYQDWEGHFWKVQDGKITPHEVTIQPHQTLVQLRTQGKPLQFVTA